MLYQHIPSQYHWLDDYGATEFKWLNWLYQSFAVFRCGYEYKDTSINFICLIIWQSVSDKI